MSSYGIPIISKQRREALGSRLLTVYGIWQSESCVKHVIAKRLVDHSHLLGNLMVTAGILFDLERTADKEEVVQLLAALLNSLAVGLSKVEPNGHKE